MTEFSDACAKLDEEVDRKLCETFDIKSEKDQDEFKKGTSPIGKIIRQLKEDMTEFTNAHLLLNWAMVIPARKDDIERWCEILNIPPAMVYAYTWMDEDFFIVPNSLLESRETCPLGLWSSHEPL